jgi:hypothetical protein
MEREAIIHIGTMKTGSTSIQNVFNKYREQFLAQGALYSRSPGKTAHQLLTYAAAGRHRKDRNPEEPVWGGIDPDVRLAQFDVEFREEMENIPTHVDRVIFSDERLSFMLRNQEDIKPLRERLAPYFSKFTVIAYLRRQDSYLASRYSELLRVGAVGEPDHRRSNMMRLQEYDYQHLLDMWAGVFGEHSIKPRIYERGKDRNFDSVDDFIAACRIDLVVSPDDRARLSNPSMNMAGQEVLREVGRLLQRRTGNANVRGALWRSISHAVTKAVPGKGWLPTRQEAAEFMENFKASNDDVRRRFFPDRAALFADESASFPVEAMQISDRERFEAACAAFLEGMELALARERAAARRGGPEKSEPARKAGRPPEAARAEAKAARAEARRKREGRNESGLAAG